MRPWKCITEMRVESMKKTLQEKYYKKKNHKVKNILFQMNNITICQPVIYCLNVIT